MKNFEEICSMTQQEVKEYMQSYLASKQYDVVCEDGFLYAKGDVPVMLVAHMDTVHKDPPSIIARSTDDNRISSPQGIGGDDRCGIYIIANIVKTLHCSVLLCEDEETGAIGANKFVRSEHVKHLDINYMIEFDRRGSNDAVFYSCDNRDFIDFVTDNTGYKETNGTFSDISVLMPATKLCGVNLSSGYYHEHTTDEYVMYDEMMATMEAGIALINAECKAPFAYVPKKYSYQPALSDGSYLSKDGKFPEQSATGRKTTAQIARMDVMLELEAVVLTKTGREDVIYGTGETKAECWLDLFTNYPYVCFNNIIDYCFM